jgi:taurine dioxygenase
MAIAIRETFEPVGALVVGWDPGSDLSREDFATIQRALREHLVLVFRDHRLPTDAELVRFAGRFGDLVKGTEWFGDIVEFPEILPITNRVGDDGIALGTGGAAEFPWHADYSYVPRPGKESFLDAVELPTRPPQTCFCSQYVALDTLPRALADPLRGRRAFHSIDEYEPDDGPEILSGMSEKRARDARLGIERPDYPRATHPIVLAHPETGREALYVSPGITRHIVDMPRDESDALLAELFEHSTLPERVYAHDWQVGDLVVFDTVGAMHRRDGWSTGEPRFMRQLSTMC